jgi:septum formation protein
MGTMSEQEMDEYLATGEPLQVAGGFTLDALGGAFVEGVEGDPSNVVGISLPTLRSLLGELGVRWTSLWNMTLTDPPSPR